jgi:hypothetical protein
MVWQIRGNLKFKVQSATVLLEKLPGNIYRWLMSSSRRFFFAVAATTWSLIACNTQSEVISQTALPEQVPYLNQPENFFIGNGYAAGGGAADGTWNFLTGPNYTCPNYLKSEEIRLVVDGEEQPFTMEVHRARKTGIFYGVKTVGDLKVYLIDYAPMEQPFVARMVRIENESKSALHNVSVRANIVPIEGPGRSHDSGSYMTIPMRWINLKLDTSLKCVMGHFCTNWADRYVTIAFDKPTPNITATNGGFVLGTATETIAPGASSDTVLYHYTDYNDASGGGCIKQMEARNSSKDLADCIAWWQAWFDGVAPLYSLSRIPEARSRDLVEGGLVILKMNESSDGGIVANERGWNMSYIRDGYCGLRGLTAFGHFEESKRFLEWLDHKYAVHGLIPNAAPGGSDIYAHPNGNNGVHCPEANAAVEVTALYILAARDYYHGTHDLATLTNIDTSLRYAMDIQLKNAITNNYRLEFSGDETELCGASDVAGLRDEGYNRKLEQYWSMTSIALCAASLDFYIQYLKARGEDPANYVNRQNHQTLNLNNELSHLQDALERDYWRTNVPGIPNGFHDWFRVKADGAWPSGRLINFTLFPVYYGTPLKNPEHGKADVEAMKQFFNPSVPLLPLIGTPGRKSLGHDLGYLLWGLVEVGDPEKDEVYKALVNGPTAGCWGTYHEAYAGDGTPNLNGLRSFETGVDLSAIGSYWGMGK